MPRSAILSAKLLELEWAHGRPGQGPVMLYFENAGTSHNLLYSERQNDGSWATSVVKSGARPQLYSSTDVYKQITDLAIQPTTGWPGAVWVEEISGQRYLRFTQLLGDGCTTGDCLDSRWDGCTKVLLYQGNHIFSVSLAYHPTLGYPAVAASYEGSSGVWRVYYWDYSNGTSWQLVEPEPGDTRPPAAHSCAMTWE